MASLEGRYRAVGNVRDRAVSAGGDRPEGFGLAGVECDDDAVDAGNLGISCRRMVHYAAF